MKNTLLLVGLLISLAPNLFAQSDNTAPIVWERYRYSDLKVSVLLPKLPTSSSMYDNCAQQLRKTGFAYAEGVVYEFTFVAGVDGSRPPYCTTPKMAFDQETMDERLNQIRQTKGGVQEAKARVGDIDAYVFKNEKTVRLMVPSVAGKWWVELAITRYPNETPDAEKFFQSLQFDDVAAKDIGDGAIQTLGDPVTNPSTLVVPPTDGAASKPPPSDPGSNSSSSARTTPLIPAPTPGGSSLQIVAKPQARYTDLARKKNETGTVRIKAVLLANGAVGSVTAESELKYGLTEQAIAAARRIVFLPARVNGVPVSKAITIDYLFSIY